MTAAAAAARLRPGETRFVPELPWTATEAVPAEEVGRVAEHWDSLEAAVAVVAAGVRWVVPDFVP